MKRPYGKSDHGRRKTERPPVDQPLQGEGNYDATRRYNTATERFVKSGKVDEAARAAAPKSPAEEAEMKAAEREGLSHAKDVEHPERAADDADAAERAIEEDAKASARSPRVERRSARR